MTGQVDVHREEVLLQGHRWPFKLDCRANKVSLQLANLTYELRPLRWGEKRNLARFAHLGERFLVREFVKLCMDAESPLPPNNNERDVLWTLARWISTPNESDSVLPLQPALLTRVAYQVAARLGCHPDELDALAACEVELLWPGEQEENDEVATASHRIQSWGKSGAVEERGSLPVLDSEKEPGTEGFRSLPPPAPGMSRIVIVPDGADAREDKRERTVVEGEKADRANLQAPQLVEQYVESAKPAEGASAGAPPATRRGAAFGRVRISMGASPQSAPRDRGGPRLEPQDASAEPTPSFVLSEETGTRDVGRDQYAESLSVVPRQALAMAMTQTVPALRTPARDSQPLPEPARAETDLLDSWTEQLEEAAEELGIEIEG